MKIVIVSMAQVAAQPGLPLDAEFWAERLTGESYLAWRRRRAIDAELSKAERALLRARENLARAIALAEQETWCSSTGSGSRRASISQLR